jgi:hypothetical protein
MAKGKKSSGYHSQERTRKSPLTGEIEKVGGPKAGRSRMRLPWGHELRSHDGPIHGRSKRSKSPVESD